MSSSGATSGLRRVIPSCGSPSSAEAGPSSPPVERKWPASPFRERVLLYCDLPHGPTLAAISRATLFALPSRREPFGIVILEAAALAIPVVASRVGGIPEVIRDGYSGVLVPPDDVSALAEAINSMLTDRERAAAQAARLQETVRRNFSLTAQTLEYRVLVESSRSSTVERFGQFVGQGGKRPVGK